ncbi:MAG TPA: Ig-like domain-containing protein [Longimicrobium sp.]
MRCSSFIAARLALAGLSALALAACSDRGPVAPATPPGEPAQPLVLGSVECTASTTARTLSCGAGQLPGGARGYIIVGGQGTYVQLTSSNVSYNSGTHVFAFDVTVQNLIPQPMGTTNGTTPDGSGVRVVFATGPNVTGGLGSATVAGADGTGTFTASNQPFYTYSGGQLGGDGILSQNETSSARNWTLNVDPTVTSFVFTLYVVAEVPHPNGYIDVTPAADSLAAGSSQALTATVRSAVGNNVGGSVTWGTSDNGVATVDASGNVTGVAPGTATITATSGARTGTATIAVCPNLALGGVFVADMPAGSSLCLSGGGSGAEYTAVPVNVNDAASVSLSVTGSGIVAVSGAPTPDRLPSSARFTVAARAAQEDFGTRLRVRDRAQLTRMIPDARQRWISRGAAGMRGGAAAGVRGAITPGVPSVGALMNLNVETDNACSTLDTRVGRVEAVGTRIIVIADIMNPEGGLSAADYQAIADSFDLFVHPVATGNFGTPSDIDSNGGRVIAFYTRAVNELTPAASSAYIGGFFFQRDLLPAASCATSNVGEMFYMLAADTGGAVNGNKRSVSFIKSVTVGTLAHEFQHMINAARRMYVNSAPGFEEVWLDEGLSHIAEELIFYNRSGLSPGGNVNAASLAVPATQDAFFTYAESNFGRLRQWLLSPHTNGGFQLDDDLATRGAAWAFLRYAADRKGGTQSTTWNALVNSTTEGMTNVQAVLGTDPLPWYRDFVGAMYADDAGIGASATYSQPSWNFRNLYANLDYTPGPVCSCAYELAVRNPSNGVADAFSLTDSGAAAYLRVGVASSAFAGLKTLSGGLAPASTVRMLVIRRK